MSSWSRMAVVSLTPPCTELQAQQVHFPHPMSCPAFPELSILPPHLCSHTAMPTQKLHLGWLMAWNPWLLGQYCLLPQTCKAALATAELNLGTSFLWYLNGDGSMFGLDDFLVLFSLMTLWFYQSWCQPAHKRPAAGNEGALTALTRLQQVKICTRG